MKIIIPLSAQVSQKKKFIYNLNNYRNAHYFTLNNAKKIFKEQVHDQIMTLPNLNKVIIIYTYFPGSKRLIDTANPISIINKFFCDALVELGKLPDDNYNHVLSTPDWFGEVDKNNPRVEAEIIESASNANYTNTIRNLQSS